MLAAQLATLPASYRPDLAVIIVGGNDVTHRVPVAESVRHLEEAIAELRARGAEVVVGSCPDLGALRPVPQPLRALGSRASRQLAQAQEAAAVRAGAHAVSLAHVVGPFFITNPDEMFSLDRFHPSAAGYKRTAKALLPSLLAALGLEDDVPFGHRRPEPVGRSGDSATGAPARLDTGPAHDWRRTPMTTQRTRLRDARSWRFDLTMCVLGLALLAWSLPAAWAGGWNVGLAALLGVPLVVVVARFPMVLDNEDGGIEIGFDSIVLVFLLCTFDARPRSPSGGSACWPPS